MADGKNSFILYRDIRFTLDKLTDEQAGKLFKHILNYVNDLNPTADDLIIELAFEPIKQGLKRDLVKWESICKRNKDNGLRGGRPKNPEKPKKPSGLFGNPEKPKKADTDTDTDTDTEEIFFDVFWDSYHEITKRTKTDKEAALKYWKKLKEAEKQKAIEMIHPYFNSLSDTKYCKKARTYLADKNFNDEYTVNKGSSEGTSTGKSFGHLGGFKENPNWHDPRLPREVE